MISIQENLVDVRRYVSAAASLHWRNILKVLEEPNPPTPRTSPFVLK
jgi:hypothetical protein